MAVLLVDSACWVAASAIGTAASESAVRRAQSPGMLGFINYLGIEFELITSVASYSKAGKAENVTENQMLIGYFVDSSLKISRYLQTV
ncbi:hypothetical protein [Jeongeupia naejangsanensis]|uniref:Uncharacterized protein n=1 Tax=Jeongeupia naejangsanensis TaxID=613195 RepID=A0ABS2BG86_9NEIS|nr:hypothetical protein [Jeongeupia naejangsanensis]MBM3114629.1 hypothetical protein [Jeongeupia naejangsanensis]